MAITSEVTLPAGTPAPTFPCLMRNVISGAILLMNEPGVGVVVGGKSKSGLEVGGHAANWDMASLVRFDGTISLKNADA